jgi:hypothetical protein
MDGLVANRAANRVPNGHLLGLVQDAGS